MRIGNTKTRQGWGMYPQCCLAFGFRSGYEPEGDVAYFTTTFRVVPSLIFTIWMPPWLAFTRWPFTL